MKTLRIISTIAVTGAMITLAPVGTASAADTNTTFALTGGNLSVSAANSASLSDSATKVDAFSVSGNLGNVTVSDNRGGTAAWAVSASSTTFTSTNGATTTTSTGVAYVAPTPSTTGTVTATSAGSTSLTGVAAPVVNGTAVSGNNTATFDPTLTVDLPAGALVGTYSGTVTTSVL